jgi:predicted ATPase
VTVIGRDAELKMVVDRIADRRLITLVGPGGIGKTTLARTAVELLSDRFPDGSRTIDLTVVDGAAAVRSSLAIQLGYASWGALLESPSDHPVLFLVDNCEHVMDAAAESIADLLAVCQMPTVLATSRAALGLADEVVIPLGPLELPPTGALHGPAIDLFVERARDAGADIVASDSVAELCRRLDGVPLAIELAAARARSMTPDEMLERLASGLGLLDLPRRRSPQRHRSLRAAIDWSFALLDPDTQTTFVDLSVFSGPFTASAAHAVAGSSGHSVADTEDRLDDLVATSMVVATADGPITRFRLLDTIRSFGREQLDVQGRLLDVEARFVDHVVDQAEAIIEQGAATWSPSALNDLLALYGNIAGAVRWCLAHDDRPDRAILLVAVLWGLVHQAHTEEIGDLADQVLTRWPDAAHPLWADAVATAATCRYMLGDHSGAIALANAHLTAADRSPFAPATLRRAIAQASRAAGDPAAASEWFNAAAHEARQRGLVSMATESDSARAQILADLGRHDEALALVDAAITEATTAGSDVGAAWARAIKGSILLRTDAAAAKHQLERSLAETRSLGYDAGASVALRSIALAELALGTPREAAARARELLDDLLARGSIYELRLVLDVAAATLVRGGRPARAGDLAATALALPVVSITASVGHELFPLDPTGGEVLSIRDAIVITRAELSGLLTDASTVGESDDASELGVFRQVGDVWEIGLGGSVTTMRSAKGLADLAKLLRSPGREIHCLDLMGTQVDEAGLGAAIDPTARRAYEARVRDLQAELEEADAANDRGRAERARNELDALVDQLTAAFGLGGSARTSGGSAERARSAVTQRIRSTIRRIGTHHDRLGRHLDASIRTGTFCTYSPEVPIRWEM